MFVPILLGIILGYLGYKLATKPKNFPHGPWNLPIVGYLPFLGGHPYLALRELSKKYGDIFSVNLGAYPAVVLSSYELIRDALKEDAFTGRPPLPFFKFRSDDKGIVFSEGHFWQETRRFTLRNLREFGFGKTTLERIIQDEVRELVESHKQNVGKPVRLHNTFNISVLNALWNITTGKRFDLNDPEGKDIIERFTETVVDGSATSLTQLIPILYFIQGSPKHAVSFVKDSKLMFKKIIEEHKSVHKEGDDSDFIHVFLDKMAQDEKEGKVTPFTGDVGLENLIIITMDLFAAGSETTSTTLLWVFLLLSVHPEVQEKVQQELDTHIGRDRMPSYDDRINLPYTEAVLLECQRFGSLVPLSVLHSATVDTKFKGYDIPKGTIIIPNLYQVMRDPKVWTKPEEFYPEHFLTSDGKVKHVDQLIPFSIGKRVCPGETLAKIELFLFATTLLQQFKFTLPAGKPKPSLVANPSVVLSPMPYEVILTLRN